MKQQTLKNNKLIAEFMVFARYTNDYYKCKYHNHPKVILLPTKNMKFNKDWNWLMPTIEKIQNIKTINTNGYEVWRFKLHATLCEADIKTTYKAVVEFIRWYNKQN